MSALDSGGVAVDPLVLSVLAAPGEGPSSSLLDFLEGAPWWVKVPVGLLVVTSPWWGPALGERRRAATSTRRRRSEPEGETDEPDLAETEDEELRKLRESLVQAVVDMQGQQRRMDRLSRDLAEKDAELAQLRPRMARMAADLAEKERDLTRMRDQVDYLIRRREQTPPQGEQAPPTDSMPRREP